MRTLAAHRVSANQLTVLACLLSAVFGAMLAWRWPSHLLLLLLPLVLAVRMALNAMDGMLAREFGQKSDLGAYLNELGDVISDLFLFSPFLLSPGFDRAWMAAAIALMAITEMSGVMGVMVGASRRYDGPMGKSDRAVVFGALALWFGLGWSFPPWAAHWFPRLMCWLLAATVVNRVRNGLAEKEITNG